MLLSILRIICVIYMFWFKMYINVPLNRLCSFVLLISKICTIQRSGYSCFCCSKPKTKAIKKEIKSKLVFLLVYTVIYLYVYILNVYIYFKSLSQ